MSISIQKAKSQDGSTFRPAPLVNKNSTALVSGWKGPYFLCQLYSFAYSVPSEHFDRQGTKIFLATPSAQHYFFDQSSPKVVSGDGGRERGWWCMGQDIRERGGWW